MSLDKPEFKSGVAFIDSGSSGGALLNDRGELIGLTNWIGGGGEKVASPVANIIRLMTSLKLY